MMKVVVILVLVAIAQQLVASNEPRQREGFTYLGSAVKQTKHSSVQVIYYYLSNERANWLSAFTSCNTQRGILATPLNPVLDDALRTYMTPNSSEIIWVGARVNSGIWFWETVNFAMQWSNFLSPICSTANKDTCLVALRQNAQWGWCFGHCNYSYNYVCEFES